MLMGVVISVGLLLLAQMYKIDLYDNSLHKISNVY